jgi:Putative phage replication protein RstA
MHTSTVATEVQAEDQRPTELAVEKKSAGVDWLTVTVKDQELRRIVFEFTSDALSRLKDQGYVQRPWSFRGYTGYSAAGFRWGDRHDSSIVMLSGQTAQLNWPVMLAWATNITRIDLAVTITLHEPVQRVARAAYDRIVTDGHRPCKSIQKYSFIENNEGGETFYLGSRASDQYGRLYDKGREKGAALDLPPGKCWRYEVEFKAYRAGRIGRQLLESARRNDDGARLDIAQTVYKWFLSRGVVPIWKTDMGTAYSTESYARVTDDDISLRWLSTQVSPTVRRLIAKGLGDEVIASLGLEGIDIIEKL